MAFCSQPPMTGNLLPIRNEAVPRKAGQKSGLFNALYKPPYERLMLGSIAAIQSASATLVTPFARAMLSA